MRLRRALLLAALLLAPSAAWPRAGGGHSFSGGSRSSSSSSRSSSSGSFSSSRSSSSYSSGGSARWQGGAASSSGGDAVGVVLLVFALTAALIVIAAIRQGARVAGTSSALEDQWRKRRAQGQQSAQAQERALASLRARDPAFDLQAFLLSAHKAFVEIQHAWSSGDFAAAHRLLSDGVLRRFTAQIALNRSLGKRNVTSGLEVKGAALAAAESDAAFDTLHVRFEASLRDCDVPASLPEPAATVRASRAERSDFVEVWSFVRRLQPGGRSGALSEGRCPNCGAPAQRATNATCPYCQAVLNSGTYDWVLSEITQESEFECRPPGAVEGLPALQELDPGANRQVLEDRASLVFWKWVQALGTRRLEGFERLCVPAVFQRLRASPPELPGVDQCAVGAVDLVSVDPSGDRQRARLLIRWSTSGAGTGLVRSNVLVLARAPQVRTDPKLGLSTDRCHQCGAPQTELDAVHCGHCQALLSQDWSFEELASPDAARPASRPAAPAPGLRDLAGLEDPRERQRVLAAMVAIARADGEVSAGERALFEGHARRWSIEPGYLSGLLSIPIDQLLDLRPGAPEVARALYAALCAAAWADGRIDPAERRMLGLVGSRLEIPAGERVRLEKEAQGAAGAAAA